METDETSHMLVWPTLVVLYPWCRGRCNVRLTNECYSPVSILLDLKPFSCGTLYKQHA
jgi:hypothetical protein